ncbi:right-handed parallel beta-helix repeat-containing protein, partial [uncultured Methanobrevibacter sp.]|uniref:right-handed parallel beta-helix repeat-containing protein n=1 Tax=uncultured Methanobrevibacter sp. TaxID=253161 RepID=UPI002610C635
MTKKRMGVLLILLLVMIISIGAISAADTNDTLLEEASDADISPASLAVEQEDNATSLESEAGSDVEISANDNSDEISDLNIKEGASSNVGEEVLSASNDDLLGENPNFYYNGKWYGDLDDAVDDACDNNGGTIYLKARAWGYDSAEREITISKGVWITFQPYNSGDEVIFDGQGDHEHWLFKINDKNAHVTFNSITFRNGGAFQGGAIEVVHGSLTLNNCKLENNKAYQNLGGGFGWGGAIFLDESDASLVANNCRFTNNNAASGGGAVYLEDGASATFTDCYFEGNKAGGSANHVQNEAGSSSSYSFNNCRFIGSGSLEIEVHAPYKSVDITPDVEDDVNYAVLYKGGSYYDRKACNDGDTATFSNLERGTYTVYMMKNWESRYEYSGTTFTIIEPYFVLNDEKVFETLSEAVNAISSGGSGVITVEGGTYTGSSNFNVQIINKRVTIRPKDTDDPVTFSSNSQKYLFDVSSNSQLTMEDITVTGKFSDIALKFLTNQECTISDCEFKNIKNTQNQPERPIFAQNSNLVLNGNNFESSSRIVFGNTVVKIDDCTFTSNHGINGGAIYADTHSDVTITNSEFTANEGTGSGGAIYANKLNIHDTTFIGNSANMGGAVYIAGGSSDLVNITGCVFDSNAATTGYRNIYSESLTRKFFLQFNEYDLNLALNAKDGAYGMEYVLEGVFDWGSNLDNNYTLLAGVMDETVFGGLLTIEDNQFKINVGVLSGGTHEFTMSGMHTQGDSNDHFYGHEYYSDLYGNEFYLNKEAYAKIVIEKARITLNLAVNSVLIPETPVLNVRANWDNNYTIIIGNKNYQLEVVNGKASMPLTGLDLGNYTVVGMRDGDENYYFVMNFTTFSVSKTYSNFLVVSTNVEYDTLGEAVANSNSEDMIYIKNGTYKETGVIISGKVLTIIALDGAIFDAQGRDANFITVNENAIADISGITFRGLHNRNTNYGAIVNHGYLALTSCNFTDNKITKTSFAENGGAAIFSDGQSLDIDSCNFINNAAPLKVSTAAVTSLGHDDVSITDSKFINNSAREGGAVHFKNLIQFEDAITSCDFEKNTAVKGSAIYVGNNSVYVSVTLSDFKKNDIKNSLGENAQLEGGVIYVNANAGDAIIDISLSNFEDNSNSKVDGGVLCLDGSSRASIAGCTFNNNSGKMGSVILIKNPYNKKLSLIMDSSVFANNNAATGAIATSPKVTALIDECVFANNTGENRHIYSNGFTVVHDSIFDVKDAKLNAPSVQYGESSIITGTADIGTNIYAAANLTVAGENNLIEIKNNAFTYDAGKLDHGKYYAVLSSIADNNNNTYLMDGITEVFRVYNTGFDLKVSVDNITYGETLKVIETLPSTATGAVGYQLNGNYYTKDEIESLKLDAGKYTLVAFYDHDDFAFTSTTVNFEVYKASPTISVPDVEVEYNDSIVLNIESDVPSIYTIEIEDYKNAVFVNGSRTIVIDKTLNPGNYTIKVTSQERVNYISNSTEAILNVNGNLPVFSLRISNTNMDDMGTDNAGEIDSVVGPSNNVQDKPVMTYSSVKYFAIDDTKSKENLGNSPDNNLGDEYEDYKFIYQYDEDSDPEYYETLEDAIDEAVTWGAGIITVRGGTYSGYGFYGIDIEGEVELTIRAYEDEEVIFDCGGENYFMVLTYDTEMEWVQVPPPPHPEFEQTDGPTVTLENITVINGFATYGGAIDLEVGTLTLMNCNFRNNNADEGGAIYIGKWDAENDATLIALNTTFINNYATSEGGAVYIASDNWDGQTTSASFMLCTFLDNYQGEDEERVRNYFAGGNTDEITCQYCIFNANGEIYNFTMDKINQTVYVNGTSNDVFDSVVLLYFDSAPLYTINNNGSRDFSITFEDVIGGNYTVGVMNDHNFNTYIYEVSFEMKVPNFIISEDEVFENLTDAIDAVSDHGVIYANVNYYYEDNMEIDIKKSFTLKNFRDDGVIFDGNSTQWFFTIAEGCSVAFEGIYFTDGAVKNHASIENYGTLVINNCTFDSFETGEIIHNSGLLNILNSTFSLNSVNNAVVWNDADLVIDTVEFSYNIVNTSSVVYTNGAADIVASNFTGNYNFGNGGAIYNAKSLSVKDTVFSENEGMDGGAVYNAGTLQVLNCTFEDNSANGYGGAIYNWNEANIFNSTFTGSSSEKDGGAIYNNNQMTVDNSTFVGNTATGKGGAIYSNQALVLTNSFFGINFAEEYANIYNAGDIQFSGNIFDFYDVILIVPDGQYGIPTTITGTLNPEFNMDLQTVLPGFVNGKDATVTISDGIFEYVTDILPKGVYDVKLDEIIYDIYGNIYYGESITDRLVINKANVYINVTVDDVVIRGESGSPVLKIDTSKTGLFHILFNSRLFDVNITDEHSSITLDAVGEGNYSVTVIREGDENYKDAANTTAFKVSKYEGKFIVNSTGNEFETLREALADSSNDDVIYVREGTYSGADNLGLTISGKKLSIISLGDVVFDANSTNLRFLTVESSSDITLCDVVITGFNENTTGSVINNKGNLTLDGCVFVNNTLESDDNALIYSRGNLTIVGSGFYDNRLVQSNIIGAYGFSFIVKESSFENNTVIYESLIATSVKSAKFISNAFSENRVLHNPVSLIEVYSSGDVLISSEFYNNAIDGEIIYSATNKNLLVNNSVFTGNNASEIISSGYRDQITISGSLFTDNAVENVVLSKNSNLSVLESTFSGNTLSGKGALYIGQNVNATVNGSVFTDNKATEYRNIYSECNVNITNSVFDALNVDYTVNDIDYGENETIEGTIDIGTNLNFTVNLDINSNSYSVNLTDSKFTYNAGILNGGDYTVVLNPKDVNSNTFVFDKITKIFTVNRVDPGLSISIADITQGEKLKVNLTISKKATANVVYELGGKTYTKKELENLTLAPGNYLVTAMYRGDKNYLSATAMDNVVVHKVAPNITVGDVAVDYGDEIEINVTVDVADYYTMFLGNESVSLYINDTATFTFPSENFKPDNYEIIVYVFETDDYAEAYAYATLTVNKAVGVFNLTNDTIIQGENATITVEVPLNAYGNIAYTVYDKDNKLVYNITQSCLEDLIVPNLNPGKYVITGTFEGDSYYSNESIITSSEIFVRQCVDVTITVSNITYGENATVTVEGTVDGDYLVYVGTEPILVTLINGTGTVVVSDLSAGNYVANVTIVDGNYSAFNETAFDVAPKSASVVISVEDILYGEDAIVQVTGEIDGEYIVEIDNQNYTVNVVDGKGSTEVYNLAVCNDILASVTIANSNYTAYNTTTFNVISKYDTPISLDVVTGEYDVAMTVTVNDNATGLVKFQVKGTEEYVLYVDVIDGKAVLEDILDIGDYTVIATYMGDARFNTNITFEDFTIKGHIKKNTTIAANADVNVDKVTITVRVDENATGFVKLSVGDTVANIELVDGVANITTILPANSYFVDVIYLGDENYNVNKTYLTFTVTEVAKENTTIDLNIAVDENTAIFDVDLNETVTGLVKFYIISKETGENYTIYMDVKDGHVEAFTDSIAAGNYTLVATYMGDSVFNTNTTSKDFEVIGHIMKDTPIEATVETNLNTVKLTVKVDENATGFVEVKYGEGVLNIALENGVGTFITELPYGSYSLDITYLGDANYNKNSTKSEFTLVEPDKATTPISLDVVTGEYDVAMTVTVDDAATGLVKFQVIGSEGEYILYADVINGKAVLQDILDVGDYTVFATYMGDGRFNTNITYEDFTLMGHIKKDTPITANADVNGNRVTVTVKVDENATGFVKLSVGDGLDANVELVDGVATLTTTLPASSYFVDVTYLGDDNYNINKTKLAFTITEISKFKTAIDLDITVDENSVLFDVGLNKTATGLVKFYIVSKETGENFTMYMDVIDGHVEVLADYLAAGNYTIAATYMGDSVFNSNIIAKDFEVIGHVLKDTPIDATVETNLNKVTLTVTVDENATGFVEVKYGDGVLNIALENGVGTFATELPYGSYSLDITYLGDANYNKNSTKSEFTLVEPDKATTPISLDVVTGEYDVAMTVTVDDAATGLVKFQVIGSEGEYILYADVINGKAVLQDILDVGDYTVFATYMGDARFNTNITYEDFTIRGHIKKDTPITANADVIGNKVTITVKVDENATGFVKLSVEDTEANVELVDGVASLTTTFLANSYFVDVAYLGDDNYNMNKTYVTFTITDISKQNTAIDLDVSVDEN